MNDLLAELFASRVRARVLRLMVVDAARGWSLTELHRDLDLPVSSLQHECYKLERIGLLVSQREGNSRRYRLDPDSPILQPIEALVEAAGPGSTGTSLSRKPASSPSLDGITGVELAFIARRHGEAPQLVLVGDVPFDQIERARQQVGRALGPAGDDLEVAFYLPADWRARVASGAPFVHALLAAPRTVLVGDPGREAG